MKRNFILNLRGKSVCALLSFLLLTLVLAGSAFAQTEKQVAAISAEVAAINKGAAKYKKTKKEVEDISLEGTEATYYQSGKNLRKITATIYGETYNAAAEFYYRDGQLIFAFVKRNQYNAPIGTGKTPKVTGVEEQRYYFANGNLIRLLLGKKELKSNSEKYAQLKAELISIASKLQNSYEAAQLSSAPNFSFVSKIIKK